MATSADMTPTTYKGGALLRRWSLIGGQPRCVLPPLAIGYASQEEISAAEAHNELVFEAVSAVEEYEAAVSGGGSPAADQDIVALAMRRAAGGTEEFQVVAILDGGGTIADIIAVDLDWEPPEAQGSILAQSDWRVGGTVSDGVYTAPPVVTPVPAAVTNFQARALMRAQIMQDGRSLETTVREMLLASKSAASALPESHPDRIAADQAWLAWEQSNEFTRSGELVNTLGTSPELGLTEQDIDNMFRMAAGIAA